MLKNFLLLVFITSFHVALAQENSGKLTNISGEIIGETLENEEGWFFQKKNCLYPGRWGNKGAKLGEGLFYYLPGVY